VTWTKTTAGNALKKFKEENVEDPTFGISESSAFKNGEFTISTVINCKGLKIEAQSSDASEDEAKSAVSVILAYKLTAAGLIETNSPAPKSKGGLLFYNFLIYLQPGVERERANIIKERIF